MSLLSPSNAILLALPPSGIAAWSLGQHKGWTFALPMCFGGTLTLAATIFYLRLRSLRRRLSSVKDGHLMPGESPNFPYGNVEDISLRPRGQMLDMQNQYGNIYVHWKMWLPIVTVSSVESVKYICSAAFDRIPEGDVFPPLFRRFLKGSIFYAGGERHKIMRRVMAPLFTRQENLDSAAAFGGTLASKFALDMRDRALANGGSLNIDGTELQTLGFDIVKQCLFQGLGTSDSDERAILDYIDSFMELMKNPLSWLPFFHLMPMKSVRDFLRNERHAHDVLSVAISRVRKQPAATNLDPKKRLSLLEQLIRAADDDKGITDFELRQNVLTLLTAGSQDAGNTLLHVCLALSKFQDAQNQVAEEANRELFSGPATPEVLKRLEWCDSCIKEAQRMFPHMNMLWTKRTPKDVEIAGFRIPALVPIAIDIISLHYDRHAWPEPQRFDPSRFSATDSGASSRPDQFHIPFGAGTRLCVAYKMGPVLLKAALGSLLQHIKFELVAPSADAEDGLRGYMDVGVSELDNFFKITPR